MWKCKDCGVSKAKRSELLKYFKLDHRNFGRRHPYPCVYSDCPCSFKTWSSLKSHVSRRHPQHPPQKDALTTYKCLLCEYKHTPSFKDYFHHIGQHLLLFNALCICIFTTSSQCKIIFFRSLFSVSLSYRLMPNFCASQPYLYNRDLWPLWTDRALSFSRLLGAKVESSVKKLRTLLKLWIRYWLHANKIACGNQFSSVLV